MQPRPRVPTAKWYEIRIRGRVPPAVLSSLGDRVKGLGQHDGQRDGPVLVTVRVTDDVHLRGLLEQLLDSGLEILDVAPAGSEDVQAASD